MMNININTSFMYLLHKIINKQLNLVKKFLAWETKISYQIIDDSKYYYNIIMKMGIGNNTILIFGIHLFIKMKIILIN